MPVCCKFDYQFSFDPRHQSGRISSKVDMVDGCQKFIGQLDQDHTLVFGLLSCYKGSIEEFLRLRRSAWPDSLFYHTDFSRQRMLLAVGIACDLNNAWGSAPMCRSVLGLDNDTAQTNMHFNVHTDTGDTFFHGLAMKVGRTHGTKSAEEWHTLIRDVLGHLADVGVLSQPAKATYYSEGAWVTKTPLAFLIQESLNARLGSYEQHVTIRSTDSTAVLTGCERAIFAWLADLYEGGMDLQIYGENEKEHFRHPELPRVEAYLSNGTIYDYCRSSYGKERARVFYVRLINFHYGRLPAHWKFWWSEPSDEFAGDFWSLVELSNQETVMNVPGAWVD